MSESPIRWFGKARRVGLLKDREDAAWVLRIGGVEHVLGAAELRTMLRAMRRLRDYFASRKDAEVRP